MSDLKPERIEIGEAIQELSGDFCRARKRVRRLESDKPDNGDSHWDEDWEIRLDSYRIKKIFLDETIDWLNGLNQKTMSFEKYCDKLRDIRDNILEDIKNGNIDKDFFHAPHQMDKLKKHAEWVTIGGE